jgi:hypothetical protein
MAGAPLFSLDAIRGSELKLCSVLGSRSPSVQGGHFEGVYIESQERRVSEASAEHLRVLHRRCAYGSLKQTSQL